jgi:hypothetical protein
MKTLTAFLGGKQEKTFIFLKLFSLPLIGIVIWRLFDGDLAISRRDCS